MRAKGLQPNALWQGGASFAKEIGLTENAAAKIQERANAGWPEKEYENCRKLGVRVLTCEDTDYPRELFELPDAPLLLYCLGNIEKLFAKDERIAVVGTRRASPYGRRIAESVGERCAAHGLPLVSGGASGIDGCAHAGCCRSGGITAAVFGTGVDVVFPASNKQLFERILEKGALLSEYPLGTKGEPWRFPRRNRIVAALSKKIIVAEAPEKSGAMITAKLALELGREVWAVPGRIDEDVASGTNRLIYDGVFPLISMDIFFGTLYGQRTIFPEEKSGKNMEMAMPELSADERCIYDLLRLKGERTVDNLAVDVKMSAADLLKIMALLSAKGIIVSSGPGRYSAKT